MVYSCIRVRTYDSTDTFGRRIVVAPRMWSTSANGITELDELERERQNGTRELRLHYMIYTQQIARKCELVRT